MRVLTAMRKRLGWKIFLSYLLVLAIGVVVLDATAELQTPSVLTRSIIRLQVLQNIEPGVEADLARSLQSAVHRQLVIGTLAGVVATIAASAFTTRRILRPIQAMTRASQRISAGDYDQRIEPSSQDELGTLAASLNQMAGVLERTERRRVELIGDVAHELRTPLSGIQGTFEGIVDGVLPSEPSTFQGLEREVTRMQRLVRDLEELSRVETGQVHLDLRSVAMNEMVEAVAQRLRPQFQDKGVTLCLEVPGDLPPVVADPNRLTQVLVNVLGNALQYTPPGGRVTVRAWMDRTELLVAVHDTGVGISAEHLPHIFERFYRVDKSRSRAGGGSGIGLTIAKHLVEAHRGRMWATSPGPKLGSTFAFALPRTS